MLILEAAFINIKLLSPVIQNAVCCEGKHVGSYIRKLLCNFNHRRRIKTEGKAKVVAAVWEKELVQFLSALDIFHQGNFEEKVE